MKQYKYTAMNINREKINGVFLAENEKDLAIQLSKQGLYLVSCSSYSGKTPSAFFTAGTGKVNMSELTTFCRQFSIMITAGIPVLECIESLKTQPFSAYFKNLLQIIYDDVKSGVSLSNALDKHKKVFPDFFRNMIYIGEVSGKLDSVFESLADYYEKDSEIKRKTKSALSYPLMLGGMMIGIIILMLVFVIPTFKGTLESLEVELNALTATIYAVSDFMTKNWLYVLAVMAALGLGIFIALKTEGGKKVFDKILISTPFIKKVQVDMVTARFAKAFSLMLSSGMDISEALDAVEVVIGNSDVQRRFKKAAAEVKHGSKLAVAFEKYDLFPQILLQMITVGEKTASLDDILSRSCKFFDDQVADSLEKLTSKIQPIMLIVMGGVIGVMFIAVYSPMISIMQNLV